MQTVDFTGTVSQATMRPQDVLPACMNVLAVYHEDAHYRIRSTFIEIASVSYLVLHDDSPTWQCEDISWLLNEDIWNAMQDIAPPGYYFGAHPGDGCDYGFWQIDDMEASCNR